MSLTVTHAFISAIPDDPAAVAAGEVVPSNWNAAHVVSGPPYPLANGNLNFYVATTGSDGNSGTIGSPFATIQHALFVAATFDYQNLWTVTIHVADGSYTNLYTVGFDAYFGLIPSEFINPPPLATFLTIVGNSAIPANVVLDGTASSGGSIGTIGFACHTFELAVLIDGFTFTGLDLGFFWQSGILLYGNLTFGSMNNFAICFDFNRATSRLETFGSTTITFTAASYYNFVSGGNNTNLSFQSTHFVFPVACAFSFAFIAANYFTQLNWSFNTYTNFAGVTGPIILGNFAAVVTDNGLVADIPGNSLVIDNTVQWQKGFGIGTPKTLMLLVKSGLPVLSDLVMNSFGIFQDTAGGGAYLAVNNNGALDILQIPTALGISATITTAKLTAGGANGSMTFVDGILTAQTPAT